MAYKNPLMHDLMLLVLLFDIQESAFASFFKHN